MTPTEVYLKYLGERYMEMRREAQYWRQTARMWRNACIVVTIVLTVVLATEVVHALLP